jgi:peptide subunit release factor 1 (eRF1)
MISKQDLERVLDRAESTNPVLSLFLDMSVNSDNKRTHQVFLNQKRAQFEELHSERANGSNGMAGVFEGIRNWLDTEYSEENRGVVIYTEVGGDWFEALQFPIPVHNRMTIGERPAVGPLAQVIESYRHHGVILLDREHVRILSVYLGTLLDEIEVHGEPYPARHDVQAGGWSQQRFQRRKQEEMKHFFREFAKEVEEYVNRYKPNDLLILGTEENVGRFREFLSERLDGMVVYTGPMRVDVPSSEVLERIEPHLEELRRREGQELLQVLRQRVDQDYLATAGFQATLTALQEGKVDTLVISQDQEVSGSRCPKCGFVFAREVNECPYDSSPTDVEDNVVEAAIRIAEEQGSEVQFVEESDVSVLRGVGALLRY